MKCPNCHRIWQTRVIGTMLHWYDKVQPEHCIWCAPESCYACYAKRIHNFEQDNDTCEGARQ